MPWYVYVLLFLLIGFAPFDALYLYIKAQRRRDALKKRREEQARRDEEGGEERKARPDEDD